MYSSNLYGTRIALLNAMINAITATARFIGPSPSDLMRIPAPCSTAKRITKNANFNQTENAIVVLRLKKIYLNWFVTGSSGEAAILVVVRILKRNKYNIKIMLFLCPERCIPFLFLLLYINLSSFLVL